MAVEPTTRQKLLGHAFEQRRSSAARSCCFVWRSLGYDALLWHVAIRLLESCNDLADCIRTRHLSTSMYQGRAAEQSSTTCDPVAMFHAFSPTDPRLRK